MMHMMTPLLCLTGQVVKYNSLYKLTTFHGL